MEKKTLPKTTNELVSFFGDDHGIAQIELSYLIRLRLIHGTCNDEVSSC